MGIFKVFFKKFEKFLIYVFKCNGNVGDIGNVCPLRHGVNAVPPFSGENGNLSTSATLLSLCDISPNRGITFCHFVTFPLTGEFPVTSDGGGFKLGVDSKMRPPPFLNGGGFKMAGGHTFCRMSAVDI